MNKSDLEQLGTVLSSLSKSDVELLCHMFPDVEQVVGEQYLINNPLTLQNFTGDGEDLVTSILYNAAGIDGLFENEEGFLVEVLQQTSNQDLSSVFEDFKEKDIDGYETVEAAFTKFVKEEAENE